MSPADIDDIKSLLNGTEIGENGRWRRTTMTWRRTRNDSWDIYGPGQCPCGPPRWEGLSLDAAADVLIARLEAVEGRARGGMVLA